MASFICLGYISDNIFLFATYVYFNCYLLFLVYNKRTNLYNVMYTLVIQYGAILVMFPPPPPPLLQLPALRALGSIVSGTDEQTQIVLDAGFLGPLQTLLQHRKENIVREAMWGLSNVTAGNANQVEMVIRANLIPLIINVMKTRTFKTQKEAAWALCNMTASGNPEQVSEVLQWMCDEVYHFILAILHLST